MFLRYPKAMPQLKARLPILEASEAKKAEAAVEKARDNKTRPRCLMSRKLQLMIIRVCRLELFSVYAKIKRA